MADAGMVLGYLGMGLAVIVFIIIVMHHSAPCDVNNPSWPNC